MVKMYISMKMCGFKPDGDPVFPIPLVSNIEKEYDTVESCMNKVKHLVNCLNSTFQPKMLCSIERPSWNRVVIYFGLNPDRKKNDKKE